MEQGGAEKNKIEWSKDFILLFVYFMKCFHRCLKSRWNEKSYNFLILRFPFLKKHYYHVKYIITWPRELSSVGMDNAKYMQGRGFKPRTPQKNQTNHDYLFK